MVIRTEQDQIGVFRTFRCGQPFGAARSFTAGTYDVRDHTGHGRVVLCGALFDQTFNAPTKCAKVPRTGEENLLLRKGNRNAVSSHFLKEP